MQWSRMGSEQSSSVDGLPGLGLSPEVVSLGNEMKAMQAQLSEVIKLLQA